MNAQQDKTSESFLNTTTRQHSESA